MGGGAFSWLDVPLELDAEDGYRRLFFKFRIALKMRRLFLLANFIAVYEVLAFRIGKVLEALLAGIGGVVERKTETSKAGVGLLLLVGFRHKEHSFQTFGSWPSGYGFREKFDVNIQLEIFR